MKKTFATEFYPTAKLQDSCGWLAPNGNFYPCVYGRHAMLSRLICKHILGMPLKGEQELEDRQWIKINRRCAVVYHLKNGLTQRQIDTLGDLSSITKKESLRRHIKRLIEND